jgi:hypothetical protein
LRHKHVHQYKTNVSEEPTASIIRFGVWRQEVYQKQVYLYLFTAYRQKDKRTKPFTPALTTEALDGSFSPVFILYLTDMTCEKGSAKIV